jgi:hypothetical protein
VVAEELAAFVAREQVPLGSTNEGVDTEVLLGRRAAHEGGQVVGGEFGGAHQTHEYLARREGASQPGAAQIDVGVLEVIRRGRRPPEHEIRVRAEAGG